MGPGEAAVNVERSVDLSARPHLHAVASRGPTDFGGSCVSHEHEFGVQIQPPERRHQFRSIRAPGFGTKPDFYALCPGERRASTRYRGPRVVAVEPGAIVREELRIEPRTEYQVGLRTDLAG